MEFTVAAVPAEVFVLRAPQSLSVLRVQREAQQPVLRPGELAALLFIMLPACRLLRVLPHSLIQHYWVNRLLPRLHQPRSTWCINIHGVMVMTETLLFQPELPLISIRTTAMAVPVQMEWLTTLAC